MKGLYNLIFIFSTFALISCGEQSNQNANLEQIQASIEGYQCTDGNQFVIESFDEDIQGLKPIDLGLSVKWASCNYGAQKAEESGIYVAWGELDAKGEYNVKNSTTFGFSVSELRSKKIIDKKDILTKDYDVATKYLGAGWRIPTDEEIEELINKCKWTWMIKDGIKGYKVSGPNGKYIFLPAKGYYYEQDLYESDESGNYWTSTAYDNANFSMGLIFTKRNAKVNETGRSGGRCIRPVYTK